MLIILKFFLASSTLAIAARSAILSDLNVIAERNYSFAHEAPVFHPSTNSVYFTSNRYRNGESQTIEISKYDLSTNKLHENITTKIPMPNGACLLPNQKILFCGQGDMICPSGLYEYDPKTQKTTLRLSHYKGKNFNSPNDVNIDKHNYIWFTDPAYGFAQGFRPKPNFPGLVWRAKWHPETGAITNPTPMLDGFSKPNGILVVQDTLFVTDTGYYGGDGMVHPEVEKAVWKFNLVEGGVVNKRRVFVAVQGGAPDGIRVRGDRVFTGTGVGVEFFGRFDGGGMGGVVRVDGVVANFIFLEDGKTLFMLNENRIVLQKI